MKPSRLVLLTLSLGLLVVGGAALPTPAHAALNCLSAANPNNYCATVLSPGDNFCCAVRDSCFYDQCTASQCVSTPPTITGPSASSTTNSITVNWQTCYSANSKLEWGTGSATTGTYNGATVTNLTQYVQNHSLGVSGLLPSTQYFYMVTSCGSTGRCAASTERTVTTAAATGDTTAPTISNIVISAGSDRATFNWTTDEIADSLVEYGTTLAFGQQVFDATLVASHVVNLTGLTPLTTYYYRITSKDAPGNSSNSGALVSHFFTTVDVGQVDRVFTTGACTDSTGKSVQIGQCSTETPPQYCHSGGVLGLDCNYCGYTCAAGQTCRVDGSCTDNPAATPNNPYQCNPAECYGANGVFTTPAASNCNSNFQRCDANSVLKVRPDRVCNQWLTPLTTVTLTNPQSRAQEQLSLSLTACTSLDPSGRCATVAAGTHCQNAPLSLCKKASDCPAPGDSCVPPNHCSVTTSQACSRDGDCTGSELCVSDNLNFFAPKDHEAIRFLTGSIQPGLTWNGGFCRLNPTVACSADRECPAANGQFCEFKTDHGRCSNDPTKACTINTASSTCGGSNPCLVQNITGRYPWDLNQQVGAAVSQLSNGGFEQTQKVDDRSGRTITTFPSTPWESFDDLPPPPGTGASVRVTVDPSLVGTTTAGSNHVLEISPTTTEGSGARAPIGGIQLAAGQTYYLSLRLRSAGVQRASVNLGTTAAGPNILDLTDAWQSKLLSFRPSSSSGSYLYVTCVPAQGATDCSNNTIYLDEVSIQTALNVAFTPPDDVTIIPRSCRLYPKEDSQSCDYTTDGVRYLGQHGYCLQRDPNNASQCVSWWPVDIIAGDGDFFGTQGKVGFSDRTPLYLCVESRGLSKGAGAGGTNYLSNPEVMWDITSTAVRYAATCDPSVGVAITNWVEGGVNFPPSAVAGYTRCPDIGSSLGGRSGAPADDKDLFQDDVAEIRVTVHPRDDPNGYPKDGTVYRLSADTGWKFISCQFPSGSQRECPTGGGLDAYDYAESRQWANALFDPGNAIGAKAVFDGSGLLQGIQNRITDGSSNNGGIAMDFQFLFREQCTAIAKVADDSRAVPWAARLASRSFELPGLKYRYAADLAPYGGLVAPSTGDPNDPSTWFAALQSEAPITDDPAFTGPQYQSRSGSPYACRGACDAKVCIGGANNTRDCSSNPSLCRVEVTTGSGKGVCQGVVSDATAKGPQQFSTTISATNPFYSEIRAQRIFAESFGISRWVHICSNDPSKSCTVDSGCTSGASTGTCRGTFLRSASDVDWAPPENRCTSGGTRDVRPAFAANSLADYCGIPPSVFNVKVNGSATGTTVASSGIVTLTFNFTADPEQTPITQLEVDWDDGTPSAPLDKTLAPQTDPNNPIVFSHPYAKVGDFHPHVRVKDNWGWYAVDPSSSASTRTETHTAGPSEWYPAPTVTVIP